MRKLYRLVCLSTALLLLMTSAALAQKRTVTGLVKDENGIGMPGVNVLIKGTAQGTATDSDGKFTLEVREENPTLVFTFVGYKTTEVSVGTQSNIDLALSPDLETLSEVVVTGYTPQRKRDITGAVSVVKVDELQTVQAASVGQKLEGRASGVTVSTSGEPGEGVNIRIRGINSFSQGSDPLWIIDGVRSFDKGNNWLNPNDIESIQVLKDASAASIYGSAASNGVIIVTTKKGKQGKTRISYNGYAGVQTPVGGYDKFLIRDPLQMAQAEHQYYANSQGYDGIPKDNYYYQYELNGTLPQYTYPIGNLGPDGNSILKPDGTPATWGGVDAKLSDYSYYDHLIMGSNPKGTDWWGALFKPALMTEHNLSVSGGTENSQFNVGTSYLKQDGTMIYTGFDRLTVRANSQFKLGKITFGENLSLVRTTRVSQAGQNQDSKNTISSVLRMHSISPIYDIDGNFAGAKSFSNGVNPVARQYRNRNNKYTGYKAFGNLFTELQILPSLKARTSLGINFDNGIYTGFNYPSPEDSEPTLSNSFYETWNQGFTWQWTNTLEFNRSIGKHHVTALGGYEAIKSQNRVIYGGLNNYTSDNINGWYLNTGLADPTTRNVGSYGGPNTLASMFGKLDYSFNDKYLVSFTVRRDGSSKFGSQQRWGTFPAASVGWRISAEPFMQSVKFVSDLKLRAGYGVTGNQNIDAGNAFDRFGGNPGGSFYDINGTNTSTVPGYNLTNRGNANTKWESTTTKNIGIDMSLFDDKLGIVVDMYDRRTDDLLYRLTVTGTAGTAQQPYTNVGSMQNRGIDIGINYRGTISDNLSFTTSLNATHYRNKVLFVNPDQDFFYSTGAGGHDQGVINKVGYAMGSFYGYKYEGVIRSDAEAASTPTQIGGNWAGGWKFQDLNGNGVIDPGDRTIIGNPNPDLTLGWNLGLNYKNFDFTMFLFASLGNKIYNYQRYFYETGRWGSMFSKRMLTDTWTPERTNAPLPELNIDNSQMAGVASSYYIENGSYLRVKTLQLGYAIPSASLRKVGISKARVYIQAQNLFTFTRYSGIDPALSNVNVGAPDQYMGIDLGNYPSSKIFSAGLSLDF